MKSKLESLKSVRDTLIEHCKHVKSKVADNIRFIDDVILEEKNKKITINMYEVSLVNESNGKKYNILPVYNRFIVASNNENDAILWVAHYLNTSRLPDSKLICKILSTRAIVDHGIVMHGYI